MCLHDTSSSCLEISAGGDSDVEKHEICGARQAATALVGLSRLEGIEGSYILAWAGEARAPERI